ncbi:MAG: ATP synthase F1 subunit epsilon [Anaerolineales bacterium]|nr:ATP synthase F1 subunit epsilon [Anaerolineales bacterium]MCX7609803.1 ATP synthase F1 subunit epsilon [Anaerolineales bacterium]MDW8227303.1 ATP synthase F1 subunit epsilon [Anaerolineales bacterium]
MPIRCEIVSQDRMVYQGEADMVLLPGSEGMMGILPDHAPLLTTLKLGVVTVRIAGREEYFTIAGGIAEVQPDQVTILADAAENVREIDVERAEAARRRAEEMLAKGIPHDTDAYLAVEAALRRSNLRLDAVKRYGKRDTTLPSRKEE